MSVIWSGDDELERFLRETPGALTAVGTRLVMAAAETAAAFLRLRYSEHRHSGNLAKNVRVRTPRGYQAPGTVARTVTSGANHAWLFEFGHQVRLVKGGPSVGVAAPHPTFIPTVITMRARLHAQLVDMVQRAGFTVSGNGG